MEGNIEKNALRIVAGTFDGENMWGDDSKIYPVPHNYASKSKLVEGDTLKLYVQPDGKFIFKQTKPVERKSALGVITTEMNVQTDSGLYKVLMASMTFFRARPGDEAMIVLPVYGSPTWAALENVIKNNNEDLEL